jgi:hypothetical protein
LRRDRKQCKGYEADYEQPGRQRDPILKARTRRIAPLQSPRKTSQASKLRTGLSVILEQDRCEPRYRVLPSSLFFSWPVVASSKFRAQRELLRRARPVPGADGRQVAQNKHQGHHRSHQQVRTRQRNRTANVQSVGHQVTSGPSYARWMRAETDSERVCRLCCLSFGISLRRVKSPASKYP